MDDGPCELVHSEELKEKFERDNDPFMYDALIERDFLTRITDIDRSIKVLPNDDHYCVIEMNIMLRMS